MDEHGPVLGADTETFEGGVKLLALSDGRFIEPTRADYTDDCLDLLYEAAKKARWVVFWNLGFDFTAIVKPWVVEHADTLRKEHYANIKRKKRLAELGLKAEVEPEGEGLTPEELREVQELTTALDGSETVERFDTARYHVVLIGSKGFSLCPRTEQGKRRFQKGREWFFDAAAWYSSSFGGVSLDYAARKFLGEGKTDADLGISRERIGSEKGYYEEHRKEIIAYCVQDCNLTARLMALSVKGFEDLGYPFPDHPFSRASVSREYLKTTGHLDKTAERYARLALSAYSDLWVKSFRGGVFLQIGAGQWKDPYGLDLNSAYPDAMVRFPSLEGAFPVPQDDPRFAGCFFKFYRIELQPTPRTPTRDRGETRKIYGWAFEEVSLCVTGLDLDVLDMMGEPYRIVDAVGIVTPRADVFPLAYLKEVYDRKSAVKKQYGSGSVQYANLKILLNGTYGILAQRKPRESQWTNLIYASYVTAWCRKKLWDAVRETEERGDYVAALATDGLLVVGEGARSYWRERDSTELGEWSYTAHEEAICYESGVGFLDRCVRCAENPDHEGAHTDTVKKRGMPNLTRKALLACDSVTWTETTQRPLKLRSALIQKRTHLLGVFEHHERTLCAVCSYRDAGMAFPREVAKAPLRSYFTNRWKLRLRGQIGDRLTPPRDPVAAAEWWAVLRSRKHERGYMYPPRPSLSVTIRAEQPADPRTTPEEKSERGARTTVVPNVRGERRRKAGATPKGRGPRVSESAEDDTPSNGTENHERNQLN